MKESHGEGVASHAGPESCVGAREGAREALTGGGTGWALSREIHDSRRGADAAGEGGRLSRRRRSRAAVAGRERAKGNSPERNALRRPSRVGAPSALERVRQAAERDRKQRFTALLHHVYDIERLRTAYHALKRDAAAGIDGETWGHYGESLEANLQDLAGRLKRGAYRAKPVRRAFIPKADGRLRPLGVPALE